MPHFAIYTAYIWHGAYPSKISLSFSLSLFLCTRVLSLTHLLFLVLPLRARALSPSHTHALSLPLSVSSAFSFLSPPLSFSLSRESRLQSNRYIYDDVALRLRFPRKKNRLR